ncbi:signal peptidase I [Candidatus Parcubacteria bacterium]|nr:signal peptidase I [Candidatus Parcubacteria bacterium]
MVKMKKAIKTILEWTVYILVFALIVWGTPEALKKMLNSEYPIASVTSSSMWPALKKGDLILIKGTSGKNDIEIGDIVVYANEKGFTIHRVIELKEDTFITKGDANNIKDKPIEYDKLIGKTLNFKNKPIRIPFLGKLSQITRK